MAKMDVNLVLLKKNGSQKSFALSSAVTLIGRRSSCDLRIPLSGISRKHCRVCYGDGELKISDLGSSNGTAVNGQRVEETVLQAGDLIEIGGLNFVVQVNGKPEKVAAPVEASKESKGQDKGAKDFQMDELELPEGDDDLDSLLDDFFESSSSGSTEIH